MSKEFETDQEPGVAHPRETFVLTGHEAAEAALADAFVGARMHHAWMLAGPKGVGKATLAYRFARRVLGALPTGPRPLDVSPEDPVARRIASRSHGDIFVLRRGLNDRGKPRGEITVEEARGLVSFFSLKPSEGGWRVAIIDAVDELNRNAANAILKTLEEPPPKTVLLLVCNSPGSTLATIRSRCRRLDLRPLTDTDVRSSVAALGSGKVDEAAVRFAGGRPGRAIALAAADVGGLYEALTDALKEVSKEGARAFLKGVYAKAGDRGQRLTIFLSLARDWVRRAAVASAGAESADPRDAALFDLLAPPARAQRLAEAFEALLDIEREAEGLDMDPTHAFARVARVLERAVA
ncbi:MAG: DNA polymerase III subunit delta' [Hyphomonadaceae bacterium]|nr:MAG: DNA polymerase III subunit delta' [Caulobacteraceae bacterium]MBT9445120.1 DNA polymerase III subunit delta' [Hyphomonadaceae bacterium]TPW08444.1 MAG: DNA polymerase III subunit delta' [Alphaproteobacteria bacterium]